MTNHAAQRAEANEAIARLGLTPTTPNQEQ